MGTEGWMEFVHLGCGLHACIVRNELNSNNPKKLNYSLVQTAEQNKDMFSTRKIQRADQVRKPHVKIGQTGVQSLM